MTTKSDDRVESGEKDQTYKKERNERKEQVRMGGATHREGKNDRKQNRRNETKRKQQEPTIHMKRNETQRTKKQTQMEYTSVRTA